MKDIRKKIIKITDKIYKRGWDKYGNTDDLVKELELLFTSQLQLKVEEERKRTICTVERKIQDKLFQREVKQYEKDSQ